MFQHFIITRFNLEANNWQKDKNAQTTLSGKWLKNRLDLFNRFCLPSVLNQTQKEFTWLIFFQQGSGSEIKELINSLKDFSWIKPIFIDGNELFLASLGEILEQYTDPKTNYVLTTRLDNDDAIHCDLIKNIQSKSIPFKDNVIIDAPIGNCIDISEIPKLSSLVFPLNQFITRVEKVNSTTAIKTVYENVHHSWPKSMEVRTIKINSLWMQIVHSQNLVNTCKGPLIMTKALRGYPDFNLHFSSLYNLKVFKIGARRKLAKIPGWYKIKVLFKL